MYVYILRKERNYDGGEKEKKLFNYNKPNLHPNPIHGLDRV
jgi:hypothetical protein